MLSRSWSAQSPRGGTDRVANEGLEPPKSKTADLQSAPVAAWVIRQKVVSSAHPVETGGFEPPTFCMPCRRATNCAMPPRGFDFTARAGLAHRGCAHQEHRTLFTTGGHRSVPVRFPRRNLCHLQPCGSDGRARTSDLEVNSFLLCQLSYIGIERILHP